MLTSVVLPSLEDILKAAERLPPFPDVVWKVVPLVQQMAPVAEIEAVIRYDQAIAARVLALSRSPQFTRRSVPDSLRDAIVALGQQRLIQVILLACSSMYFDGEAQGYDLRSGELWEHSVATAVAAELIARRIRPEKMVTVYAAALLHDIGKSVLCHFVRNSFDAIISLVREKKMRFIDAEREALGIDHQELGAMIAKRWNLPQDIQTAIGWHHQPRKAPACKHVVSIVYAVNRMISAVGIGCGVDGFLQPNEDEVFVELGITTPLVDKVLCDVLGVLEETKQFLSPQAGSAS